MLSKQAPSPLFFLGALAGAAVFVAFVALMEARNLTVSPMTFAAIVMALAACVALSLVFRSDDGATGRAFSGSSFESRTAAVGAAGALSGSAGVEAGAAGVGAGLAPDPVRSSEADGMAPALAPGPETAETTVVSDMRDEPDAAVHRDVVEEQDSAATEPVPDGAAVGRIKSGTLLKGEQELATRNGSWKYQKSAEAGISAGGDTAAEGSAGQSDAGESTNGVEPMRLSEAREGGPDDLKRIRGIGPKLEVMLHRLGFFHYDQIARWSDAEAAWVEDKLPGFRGRISRDGWVEQARRLASVQQDEGARPAGEPGATS